jgi:hypothetical protein
MIIAHRTGFEHPVQKIGTCQAFQQSQDNDEHNKPPSQGGEERAFLGMKGNLRLRVVVLVIFTHELY